MSGRIGYNLSYKFNETLWGVAMITYIIKHGMISFFLQMAILIAVLSINNNRLDLIICLIGSLAIFLHMLFVKRRCTKIVCVPIETIKSMDIVPMEIEYKKGKFILASKIAGVLLYVASFTPIALYLGEDVFYYYAMQPYGYNEKITNSNLILAWAFLMILGIALVPAYYKLKEASIIYNTEDAEERSWRQGLSYKITHDAQELNLLYTLLRTTR